MKFLRDLIDTIEIVSEEEIIKENLNFQQYGTLSVDKDGNAMVTMKCRNLVDIVNNIATYRDVMYLDGTHLFMYANGNINPDLLESDSVDYNEVQKSLEIRHELYNNLP